jgi:hypothetical protein
VGLAAQAQEMTQAVQNAEDTSWIGALFVYTYQDSATNPDYYGLVNADGTPKPAWSALAAADGMPLACSIASQSNVILGQPCDVDVSDPGPAPAVATPEIASPILLPLAALALGAMCFGLRKRRLRRTKVAVS